MVNHFPLEMRVLGGSCSKRNPLFALVLTEEEEIP